VDIVDIVEEYFISMPHPKIFRIPLADEQWKIATMQFARGPEF
jgi:hypothetical protein